MWAEKSCLWAGAGRQGESLIVSTSPSTLSQRWYGAGAWNARSGGRFLLRYKLLQASLPTPEKYLLPEENVIQPSLKVLSSLSQIGWVDTPIPRS